ncbi:ABC transporter permease [Streptomyces albireticuli]|nr:ABC transporter permease [Streptomyces albireticuli]MCD9143884.1 ABC transporter permease [Streptomyces albireticuli]MCD9161685.1 ABC transporter permease [Streptomyces albireticuli]MCD9192001.1 ABC transporter permease [Streptomyces albireticuli]
MSDRSPGRSSSASSRGAARKILVIVAIVQFVIGGWFSWTASRAAPRELPVVVAADVRDVAGALRAAAPGAYRVEEVPDAAAADAALRHRKAYGAFVPGTREGAPELRLASAASPAAADALARQARELPGVRLSGVVDVVPADADDPHGAGAAMGFLPLLITAVIAGLLLVLKVRDMGARLLGVVGFAVLSGLLSSLMLTRLSGVLPGGWAVTAGVVALLELAMVAVITGLGSLVGPPGVAVGAVLMFVVGNPLSGMGSAPEMLPGVLGSVGQYLPPGAGASLLRSVGAFGGAGASGPVLVLVGWVVVGLGALALAARRGAGRGAGAGAGGGAGAGAAARGLVPHPAPSRTGAPPRTPVLKRRTG